MKKSAFINTSNLSKQSQICVYIFMRAYTSLEDLTLTKVKFKIQIKTRI